MFVETECGICYRDYNAGSRCPRQLGCKHTFCERCLLTLARSPEPRLLCPLCRHSTTLSDARIQDTLPVDEDILQRVVTTGVSEEDEDSEEPTQNAPDRRKEDSSPRRATGGRLVKSVRRLWRKIIGDGRADCLTDEDLRDLAMMSCWMT